MGRDLLQREALRRQLRQRQLARLKAVAARALHGNELHGEFLQREVWELLHLALYHDRPAFALQRLDAEQDRDGAGAGGAIERDVDAFAVGDFLNARQRVFLLHVDDVIRAELFGDFQARAVLRRAGDDDERCARLFTDHRLRQPLLARALNQYARVVADTAVEQ